MYLTYLFVYVRISASINTILSLIFRKASRCTIPVESLYHPRKYYIVVAIKRCCCISLLSASDPFLHTCLKRFDILGRFIMELRLESCLKKNHILHKSYIFQYLLKIIVQQLPTRILSA